MNSATFDVPLGKGSLRWEKLNSGSLRRVTRYCSLKSDDILFFFSVNKSCEKPQSNNEFIRLTNVACV